MRQPRGGRESFLASAVCGTAPGATVRAGGGSGGPATRRVVACVVTLVVGVPLLRASLTSAPGDPSFVPMTAALAVVWAVGAMAAGPVPWRGTRSGVARSLAQGLVLGAGLLVVFLVGAMVVAQVPALAGPVRELLDHARPGRVGLVALLTAVNGVAEEMFFRGALFDPSSRRPVVTTAVAYTLVTATSGIALLALAALLLGLLTGVQRRAGGGILAPVVTHLVWSLGMLTLLPSALDLAARLG